MKRPTQITGNRQFLEEVAEAYRDAVRKGDRHPCATIAQRADVQPRTAARWVALARDVGALGPARKGKSGEFDA
jgi:transposase-like protein